MKIFTKEYFLKTSKEYLWSLWYALPDTFSQLVGVIFYCAIWSFLVYKGMPFLGALYLVFMGMLGSNQFSYKNIKQVEKKVGYKIMK